MSSPILQPGPSSHLDFIDHVTENNFQNVVNSIQYGQDNRAAYEVSIKQQRNNQYAQQLPRNTFIIELDDDKEIDILKCLLDPYLPSSITLLSSEFDLLNYKDQTIEADKVFMYNKATRFLFEERNENKINQTFNYIIQQAHLEFVQSIIKNGWTPCIVCSLKSQVKINDNNMIDVIFTASILRKPEHQMLELYKREKDLLDVRSDINLPDKIKEALDEQGQKLGEDAKINIDLSVGLSF